jgi:hypothetical protein
LALEVLVGAGRWYADGWCIGVVADGMTQQSAQAETDLHVRQLA